MHKDIDKLENFLFKVKQETDARSNKAPPIVLRSLEGFHEEQYAIYKQRSKYEGKKWGQQQLLSYNNSPEHKKAKTSRMMTHHDYPMEVTDSDQEYYDDETNLPVKMFDGFGETQKNYYSSHALNQNQNRTYYTTVTHNHTHDDTTGDRSFNPNKTARPNSTQHMFIHSSTSRGGRARNFGQMHSVTNQSNKNQKSQKDVLLSSMTPAQVNNEYPMVFDKWQL